MHAEFSVAFSLLLALTEARGLNNVAATLLIYESDRNAKIVRTILYRRVRFLDRNPRRRQFSRTIIPGRHCRGRVVISPFPFLSLSRTVRSITVLVAETINVTFIIITLLFACTRSDLTFSDRRTLARYRANCYFLFDIRDCLEYKVDLRELSTFKT